ncbi:MAG: hypothetical protein ACRELF_04455 [Gemmataceae bacterium]
MSEHIQSAPDSHAAPAAVATEAHEHTPGVAHESEVFDFRLILWVGAGLVVTAVIVQVVVWWLFGSLEKHNTVPPGSVSELAKEDATLPFEQRLDKVPAPHLEGIERENNPSRIAAARQRAEARRERYGWIDRDKEIVHVPIEKAMEEVLKAKEFAEGKQKKSAGHTALPTRSSSGRAARGGQR